MTLLNISRQATDPVNGLRRKVSAPPDAPCPRCGGLMIQEYGMSWEWKDRGQTVTSRRCINCGNCLDLDILANRGKSSLPARPRTRRARLPKGPS
jgi:hypothetical protein